MVLPDLHGRLDAMEAMLLHSGLVDAKLNWKGTRGERLVQLGDLVDRGKEVKACVAAALKLKQQAPRAVTFIKGNHEDMLLNRDASERDRDLWERNGGKATLLSYGAEMESLLGPQGEHTRFLQSLPSHLVLHQVLFAHGGLQADAPDALDDESLMWSRPPLTKGKFRALVSGHTPTQSGRVEVEDNVFYCDLGLGHKEEASFQYTDIQLTPQRLRWTVRVAN